MLLGVPREVNQFFRPIAGDLSKPIRSAIAPMVLAMLLAPHRRRLKTIAGMVLGGRVHAGTISRRLSNPLWTTRDWYERLSHATSAAADRDERPLTKKRKRRFYLIFDSTLHHTFGVCMGNTITLNTRKDSRRKITRHHLFVMGLLFTDTGVRIPLPRKSYYSKEYCNKHNRKYRTQNDLAVLMINDAPVPPDAEVIVLFDSAFDCDKIHRACRRRGFFEVFPIDPGRVEAEDAQPHSLRKDRTPVVAGTLDWEEKEFTAIELDVKNEAHAEIRRRHVDNHRVKKTRRKYVVAGRRLSLSKLGECLVVASYKENPDVELLENQSERWQDHRVEQANRRKSRHDHKKPSRWLGKVLACTVPGATAADAVELYELRWQIELFFRELKSRMQLGEYVLFDFRRVERYLDLILMGFLYLERRRLDELRRTGRRPVKNDRRHHDRTTDRLRTLEADLLSFNCQYIKERIGSRRGRTELMRKLETTVGQVA